MAFTAYSSKIGSRDCNEAYPLILNCDNSDLNDNVMLSVLRVLINDDRIKHSISRGHCIQSIIDCQQFYMGDDEKFTKDMFVHEDNAFNQMKYGIMFQSIDDKKADAIVSEFKKYNSDYEAVGWKSMSVAAQYIDKNGNVYVYQNEEKQGIVVVCAKKNLIQAMHMAASCLPNLMPWFFADQPLTDDEKAMLRTLYDQDNAAFGKYMEKAYETGDFYGKKLRGALKGFCKRDYNNEIDRQERYIREIQDTIDRKYNDIREQNKNLEEAQLKLTTIMDRACCTEDDEAAIVNFLKRCKTLVYLYSNSDRISIGYVGMLNDCDEGEFRTCVEKKANSRSYIFNRSPYDTELTKDFFVSIWKTHRFAIRTYCEWRLYSSCKVEAIRGSDMQGRSDLMKDRIRQPHIDRHACYSGYREMFNALSVKHDYIGVLTTIIGSSASLNWKDGTVVSDLMYDLFDESYIKTRKCIEDNAGNLYTVAEVFDILKKEKDAAAPAEAVKKEVAEDEAY